MTVSQLCNLICHFPSSQPFPSLHLYRWATIILCIQTHLRFLFSKYCLFIQLYFPTPTILSSSLGPLVTNKQLPSFELSIFNKQTTTLKLILIHSYYHPFNNMSPKPQHLPSSTSQLSPKQQSQIDTIVNTTHTSDPIWEKKSIAKFAPHPCNGCSEFLIQFFIWCLFIGVAITLLIIGSKQSQPDQNDAQLALYITGSVMFGLVVTISIFF